MRRIPESPRISRFQVASTPFPKGVTRPKPVITTRRIDFTPLIVNYLGARS